MRQVNWKLTQVREAESFESSFAKVASVMVSLLHFNTNDKATSVDVERLTEAAYRCRDGGSKNEEHDLKDVCQK